MMRKRIAIVGLCLALAAGVNWITAGDQRNHVVWDHWDVVVPGTLYRSGHLKTSQLREAISRYGLKTVVSFQTPGRDVETERALAQEMGIDFINLPMPGDGFGQEAQFREVLAATDDPARRPVLVHCARGTCRTGASVALYRFERNGWTIDDVSAEMLRQTYREGWLPGYVYNMVRERPGRDLFEPRMSHDKNLPTRTAAEQNHVH